MSRAGPSPRLPDDPRNGPVLLRKHLIAQGWSDRAIRRQLADRTWTRLRHGSYVPTSVWAGLDAAGKHGLLTRAVVARAAVPVVVSHISAVPEYDAPTWGLDLSLVHVTRPDGRAGRREAGVQQHCGEIVDGDVIVRNGLRVMSPTRAALEVTTVADVEASLALVNHLLHAGLTTPAQLRDRYAAMAGWPHTLHTDVVLRLADGRLETVGESRTLYLLFRQGLPLPIPQYEIRDRSGRVIARVDFAWPGLGAFLEFDGRVKYERLLTPSETASDVVVREKRREDLIRELTGWRCVRITWADLARPEQTAARIRAVLAPG